MQHSTKGFNNDRKVRQIYMTMRAFNQFVLNKPTTIVFVPLPELAGTEILTVSEGEMHLRASRIEKLSSPRFRGSTKNRKRNQPRECQ